MTTRQSFLSELVAAKGGSPTALQSLCERFNEPVRRRVHHELSEHVLRNRPWLHGLFSTADVVQEVFLDVIRDPSGFSGSDAQQFENYLAAITRHRVVDAIRFHEAARRDRRRDSHSNLERASHLDEPVQKLLKREELRRVADAMQSFPPRLRILIRERLESQTSFADLASELGYASAESARKCFRSGQARLLARLAAPSGRPVATGPPDS